MNQQIRDALCDMGYEEAVVFDGPDFDEAIVGVTDEGQVVYDYDMMVHCLRIKEGWSEIDAIEFIEYNTIRALPYVENAPIIMHRLRLEEEEDHGTD
jgi:hypothetical protein